ncbi:hypothetical protein ACIHFE_02705 [Streptomyces sp. NPDC052396]|uniref:hypothetical protein n=1 Tax=Streptomyces sp. NPDC052396 TaxID=3365689 RepID=UPI0037D0D30D
MTLAKTDPTSAGELPVGTGRVGRVSAGSARSAYLRASRHGNVAGVKFPADRPS